MTHTLIYPHTTVHNAAGHLEIGGCDVVELAREFETPLFIYDEQTVRDQCRAYHSAFRTRTDSMNSLAAASSMAANGCSSLISNVLHLICLSFLRLVLLARL